jgi:hypothetical protein
MKAAILSPYWAYYKFLFDTNLSENNLRLDFMRTVMTSGFPLEIDGVQYKTYSDDPDDKQYQYYEDFIWKLDEAVESEFRGDFKEFYLMSGVLTDDVF